MKCQGPCKSIKEILEEEWGKKPGQETSAQSRSGYCRHKGFEYRSFHLCVHAVCGHHTCRPGQHCLTVFHHSLLYSLLVWESLSEPVSILMILLCPPPKLWGFRHMLLYLVVTWMLGLKLKSSAWWQVLHPPRHLLASTSSFKWRFVNTPPTKVLASMLQVWGCEMWLHSLQES